MSDIHILTGDGKSWNVVFHFPVADLTNVVGNNYRTCLVNAGQNTTALTEGTGPGQISTAELAQITAGELFEASFRILIESGGTSVAQRQAQLEAAYNREKTRLTNELQNGTLKYFGYTYDVP